MDDDGTRKERVMLFLARQAGYRLGESKVLPRRLSGSQMILVRNDNEKMYHCAATRMHSRQFRAAAKATKGGRKVGTGGTRDLASEDQPHQDALCTHTSHTHTLQRLSTQYCNAEQQRHPLQHRPSSGVRCGIGVWTRAATSQWICSSCSTALAF